MHSATKRRETREKMKDGGKKNPHKSPHWLPTIFIQSFRVSAWLPVTVAMVSAHFINEEICQGGEKDRSSAALTETCSNLREQKAPLRPLLLLFCSNYAAAFYRFQWNSYEQLSHPSSSWIFLLNQLNPQFSRRQSKCDGENQVGVARTEDFAHNLVEE